MGSFDFSKFYSKSEILCNYDSYNSFIIELVDYVYNIIECKNKISDSVICDFFKYLDYFSDYSLDVIDSFKKLDLRIIQVKNSRSKNEKKLLKNLSDKLSNYVSFDVCNDIDSFNIDLGLKIDKLIFSDHSDLVFSMFKSKNVIKYKYQNGQYLVDKVLCNFFDSIDKNSNFIEYYQKILFYILSSEYYRESKKISEVLSSLRDKKNKCSDKYRANILMRLIDYFSILTSGVSKKDYLKYISELKVYYGFNENYSGDDLFYSRNVNCIKDLRNIDTFTIDSHFKSAYDDAIALSINDSIYSLYIFISDVASYVPIGSELYNYAFNKCESIYTSDADNKNYISMFPVDITRDLFSLNQGVDRYVLAHKFNFKRDGGVFSFIDYNIDYAVINVNKNYSYDDIENLSIHDNVSEIINELYKLTNFIGSSFNNGYHLNKEKNNTMSRNKKYVISRGYSIVSNSTIYLNSFVASRFNGKFPCIYRNNSTSNDYLVSHYSHVNCGHSLVNGNPYCHVSNPIRSFVSYLNQYFEEYFLIDWNDVGDIISNINKYNLELPLLVDNINKQLCCNEMFVGSVKNLFNKTLTKKR